MDIYYGDLDGREPVVCDDCGGLVVDETKHNEHHEYISTLISKNVKIQARL